MDTLGLAKNKKLASVICLSKTHDVFSFKNNLLLFSNHNAVEK